MGREIDMVLWTYRLYRDLSQLFTINWMLDYSRNRYVPPNHVMHQPEIFELQNGMKRRFFEKRKNAITMKIFVCRAYDSEG